MSDKSKQTTKTEHFDGRSSEKKKTEKNIKKASDSEESSSDEVKRVNFYSAVKLMKEVEKIAKKEKIDFKHLVVYFSYAKPGEYGRTTNILRLLAIDNKMNEVKRFSDIKGMFNLSKGICKSNNKMLER